MPGQPCCSGFFFAHNIINQNSRNHMLDSAQTIDLE
jgi:hypothetical protein